MAEPARNIATYETRLILVFLVVGPLFASPFAFDT
jgi:hypothetical protein